MDSSGLFVENIETSHSDKNIFHPLNSSVSPYTASRTASNINNRLQEVSRRVSVLQNSKSISKTKYHHLYTIQKGCQPKLLNFSSSKEHEKTLQQILKQSKQEISTLKQKVEELQDDNYKLQQQQVQQEQKMLKMQKKYIIEINRLHQLLGKNDQKELEYEKLKYEVEKQIEKERCKVRRMQAEAQIANKCMKREKKNEQVIRKLRKKYADAYYGYQGQIGELARDIDKNLSALLSNNNQKKDKKIDLHKFFDREEHESDKQNSWDPNTMKRSLKYSVQTHVPMKQSILLKQELQPESMETEPEKTEDLFRIMFMQAETIENYLL